eukprot:m.1646858 g.1646858  ORF g.1646858 m.1646858 type:complete len:70 (-) comp73335_c0_seq1:16-225(-)
MYHDNRAHTVLRIQLRHVHRRIGLYEGRSRIQQVMCDKYCAALFRVHPRQLVALVAFSMRHSMEANGPC